VPDVIEVAKTGRSKCRGCGHGIPDGELRFGESLPNPYADGESLFWFHLICAACMRPEKFCLALDTSGTQVPERAWLRQTGVVGQAHRRLPRLRRAERAVAGRARCRLCRELISQGSWRLALQMFEEGRMTPIGTIHVECAEAYFGTANILDRIQRLTDGLSQTDLSELGSLLEKQRPAPEPTNDTRADATRANDERRAPA
jgi:hypothetical protein